VTTLLQALYGFVVRHAELAAPTPGMAPAPWSGPAQSPQGGVPPGYYPQPPDAGFGGMFGNFANSGFGRAVAAGAGFGIGDTVISRLFGGRGGCQLANLGRIGIPHHQRLAEACRSRTLWVGDTRRARPRRRHREGRCRTAA
jgi:hypothetical protein